MSLLGYDLRLARRGEIQIDTWMIHLDDSDNDTEGESEAKVNKEDLSTAQEGTRSPDERSQLWLIEKLNVQARLAPGRSSVARRAAQTPTCAAHPTKQRYREAL